VIKKLETVRWGIIGVGNVTEIKSGPAFRKIAHSELVAVMRRDGAKARAYAQRHGVRTWYDDAKKLIDDAGVDAVYVATPPSTHKQYALAAIAARKPVYIEKPMAMNAAECEEIVCAGAAANVPVFVAYYRRRLPRFLKVQQLLRDGAIGAVRLVNVLVHAPHEAPYRDPANLPWHVQPEISGGGLFVDIGCHTLDLLDFLLGPITLARGHTGNQLRAYPAEDSVAMSFAFGNGVLGTGLWNFGSYAREDRVEIIGEAGRIVFATFGDTPIRVENGSGARGYSLPNPPHIQQPLIETIVAELRGETGACPSTGSSGTRTSRVMDQVLHGNDSTKLTAS
jgi:1,5-anhydro-D-fructose reductase (1,5-anhydro-D-mannitol-forming)